MKMQKPRLSFLLLVCLSIFSLRLGVESQSLPPVKYDGFVYKGGPVDPNPILIEAFYDPVCPDSRDSWPPLKLALGYYASRVSLRLHLLPLPYHDNAYVASRAMHIANMLNESSTFPLLERFFMYQSKFYNDQTKNQSRTTVLKEVVDFASVAVGNSLLPQFRAAFTNSTTDLKTRVSFKFSTSRGVYGTPAFFVNGFVLPGVGSPIGYNTWRKIIDPLITTKTRSGFDTTL